MDTDGGIEIRICRAHDGRRGAARGEAGDEDTPGLDRDVGHDLPGDPGDQRGLAAVALLIGGAEPIPAFLGIGRTRLLGVGDEEALLFGQLVHPRAGGKILGRLGAAMQHHHQGKRLSVIGAGNVEPVGAPAGRIGVASLFEASAVRARATGRRRCPCAAAFARWRHHVDDAGGGLGLRALCSRLALRRGRRAARQGSSDRGHRLGEPAGAREPCRLDHGGLQGMSHGDPVCGRRAGPAWRQRMRSFSAAFTSGLACRAPSTSMAEMV
jgi:hypothetical protein